MIVRESVWKETKNALTRFKTFIGETLFKQCKCKWNIVFWLYLNNHSSNFFHKFPWWLRYRSSKSFVHNLIEATSRSFKELLITVYCNKQDVLYGYCDNGRKMYQLFHSGVETVVNWGTSKEFFPVLLFYFQPWKI